jgi:hypothetical protein
MEGPLRSKVPTSSETTVLHFLYPVRLEIYNMLGKSYLALAVAILPTVSRGLLTATLCMLT